MRKIAALAMVAVLTLTLLSAVSAPAAAANNPVGPDDVNDNWGEDPPAPGTSTIGHGNPASGYDSPGVTDDTGVAASGGSAER